MTLNRGVLLHKRYRILELFDQGELNSQYYAKDESLGVDVVIKENLYPTEEYALQFRLEAVTLASFRHPNLPRVTDHFTIDGQGQYLVIDYIEGEDLLQRLKKTDKITEDEAILIGAAICDGLTYLHTRKPPVLHSNIVPRNIILGPDGHIFLTGFYIVRVMHEHPIINMGSMVHAMVPNFSAPEEYLSPGGLDPRSDIYSLGATLYTALTGFVPEDGLARVMDEIPLLPLRQRNIMISQSLALAIEKALATHPSDRFQTAEDFQTAILESKPIPLRVFICHAKEDKTSAQILYDRLKETGFSPWLDERELLPGQDWRLEIEKAVKRSDAIIICISQNSINKEGYVQKEITYALEIAQEKPEGTIYLIPLRLEECDVPHRLERWQWVNYFEENGFKQLMLSLRHRANNLQRRRYTPDEK